jgi:CelD/BcsL family acetyltransferase involved in cellulose biosynthesis
MRVVVAQGEAQLRAHLAAWDDLAGAVLEPNVFYESWFLLPALRHLGAGLDLRFVLIYATEPDEGSRVLCGLFPLESRKRYKALPVNTLGLWKHIYSPLCTPLIRASHAKECLRAFAKWLAEESGNALLEMPCVAADGPFHQHWNALCKERALVCFTDEQHSRALLKPLGSSEDYLHNALSRKRRKELKRQENRLAELGHLAYECLETAADAPRWIEEFLQLEAKGWKGREGTAFACAEADQAFFLSLALGAYERGQLMLLALRLDGKPLAMKFNMLSGEGGFAFKIAFDEDYARFSPGALLELENIRRTHLMPQTRWMDSCAIPGHFMINRLWTERRLIQHSVVSTGSKTGDLVVALLPRIRRMKNRLRPCPKKSISRQEMEAMEDNKS